MLRSRTFLLIQRLKNTCSTTNGCSPRIKSTQNLSRSLNSHFCMQLNSQLTRDPQFAEYVASASDPHLESMIASLSCVSTGKCNSMVELFTSTGNGRNRKIFQNLAFCPYGKEYAAASLGLASNNFPKGSIISVVYISDDTLFYTRILAYGEACLLCQKSVGKVT